MSYAVPLSPRASSTSMYWPLLTYMPRERQERYSSHTRLLEAPLPDQNPQITSRLRRSCVEVSMLPIELRDRVMESHVHREECSIDI